MNFTKAVSVFLATLMAFLTSVSYRIIGEPKTAVLSKELVRDGSPKKYFVLAFDDGITQDKKIIDICKRHNFDGCTFFINTGLPGANWTFVGESMGKPEVTHIRFTQAELRSGIYDGFDVAVHTLSHPSLKEYDDNPIKLRREVQKDADNIYKLTGVMPLGMAWPGGDPEVTDATVENVLKYTTVRYARGTGSTYNFELPERFLKWYPTCSITDSRLTDLTQQFLAAEPTEDMVFFVWGHGYELDGYELYDELEQLIKEMSESETVVCVTATELYLLFKDEIKS